ncbi:MAG: thermonuclease family protein [Microthrixaceae bacterium]
MAASTTEKHRALRFLLLCLSALFGAALMAAFGCSQSSIGDPTDALEANATVTRVVDGDTILVMSEGTEERVRLIGINTPESVHPTKPVMCFGKEASKHLASLLTPTTPVQLVRDVEARDKYGRLLAYVYRAQDGLFINLELVTAGYANQYTFPPNVAHTEQFRAAASKAREEGLGLWSACPKPFEE